MPSAHDASLPALLCAGAPWPIQDVTKSEQWLGMDKEQVVAILRRSTLNVESEDAVLDALKLWGAHEEHASRRNDLCQLFRDRSVIRRSYLSNAAIADLSEEMSGDSTVMQEMRRRLLGNPPSPSDSEPRTAYAVGVSDPSPPEVRKEAERAAADGGDDDMDGFVAAAALAHLGARVRKRFPKGWYYGTVASVSQDSDTGALLYRIHYDDGDKEDLHDAELGRVLMKRKRRDGEVAQGDSTRQVSKRACSR